MNDGARRVKFGTENDALVQRDIGRAAVKITLVSDEGGKEKETSEDKPRESQDSQWGMNWIYWPLRTLSSSGLQPGLRVPPGEKQDILEGM
jgi:hypothetical protein